MSGTVQMAARACVQAIAMGHSKRARLNSKAATGIEGFDEISFGGIAA